MERPRTVGDVAILLARAGELATVIEVERRSSVRFAEIRRLRHWVDDPTAIPDLEAALARGMLWVAEVDGAIVGWCYASPVDDSLFVEQIDVVPELGRRGIGARLLDTVRAAADGLGLDAVTLTTEADVPWNRPWYEKVGFRVLRTDERGPDLDAKVAHEAERGLDITTRVAMRRAVR
jgi:GNAT superfamily N-acetyltransferase